MRYTRLGHTGLTVSRICLGCMSYGDPAWRDWVLDEAAARPFYERALDAGINFFDTADVYSNGVSEEILGRAMQALVSDREDVVIATKCFGGTHGGRRNRHGLSRKNVIASCEASLRRLGTDYIDLYQIHRFDPETPIEETLEALDDLVRAGKVRYLGASSMWTWQFARYQALAVARGWSRFVAMQNHYNLIYREEEREMIPFCLDDGVGLIPWSPLARGFLAGNRDRSGGGATTRAKSDDFAQRMYYADNDFEIAEANAAVAARRELKPAQTALAWVLAQPGVSAPIIGATRLDHLEDALAAVEVELSAEELAELSAPYRPHPVLGHR
ncbi:MAG: aldo/keto reductase [Pseudomonadales bacterium]|jgi:aryl-alcohol dehydrogenase (NADP+)|nr:aldo/keto reductase [Pseudomonadales bacterium]